MAKYAAFLRGVNVGGHNLIRMEELRRRCAALGFTGVSTYKQSGNVVFESLETDPACLARQIETLLQKLFGSAIKTTVRPVAQLQKIVRLDPFAGLTEKAAKGYVSLLLTPPIKKPRLPLLSPNGATEILLLRHDAAFCVVRPLRGRYTDPNIFLQSALGVSGTIRNWNTLATLAALA